MLLDDAAAGIPRQAGSKTDLVTHQCAALHALAAVIRRPKASIIEHLDVSASLQELKVDLHSSPVLLELLLELPGDQ